MTTEHKLTEHDIGKCFRHNKTGHLYQIKELGQLQIDDAYDGVPAVIYFCVSPFVGDSTPTTWVRPASEWFELVDLPDGQRWFRFERVLT